MKLTIHIGAHKTGTTAIQRMLAREQHELRRRGVLVPTAGVLSDEPAGHHGLAFSAADQRFGVPYPAPWIQLRDELRASDCEQAVISAEAFWLFEESQIARVVSQTADLDVRIVLYIRDRASYLVSAYKENVRSGRAIRSFDALLPSLLEFADFAAMADRWSTAFGRDAMVVRSYEDADSDVCNDLLRVLGVSDWRPTAPDARPNEALGNALTRLVRAVNVTERVLPGVSRARMTAVRRWVIHSPRVARWAARLMPWLDRPLWKPKHDRLLRSTQPGAGG